MGFTLYLPEEHGIIKFHIYGLVMLCTEFKNQKGGRQEELESEWRECKCNEYESAFAGVFILGWFVSGCMLARKRKVHKTRRVEYK